MPDHATIELFSERLEPGKRYQYDRSCAECDDCVDALNYMTANAKDVTYGTMLRNCDGLLDWAVEKGFSRRVNQGSGVTLRLDPYVSYHKSTFQGTPCFYLCWSGFEIIWVLKQWHQRTAELGGKWIRDKLREAAYSRHIKPPEEVNRTDQQRSVNHDVLVKIVDVEPQSRAMGIVFRDQPVGRFIKPEEDEDA